MTGKTNNHANKTEKIAVKKQHKMSKEEQILVIIKIVDMITSDMLPLTKSHVERLEHRKNWSTRILQLVDELKASMKKYSNDRKMTVEDKILTDFIDQYKKITDPVVTYGMLEPIETEDTEEEIDRFMKIIDLIKWLQNCLSFRHISFGDISITYPYEFTIGRCVINNESYSTINNFYIEKYNNEHFGIGLRMLSSILLTGEKDVWWKILRFDIEEDKFMNAYKAADKFLFIPNSKKSGKIPEKSRKTLLKYIWYAKKILLLCGSILSIPDGRKKEKEDKDTYLLIP